MRKFLIALGAVAALLTGVAVTAAMAQSLNNYSASFSYSQYTTGTPTTPVGLGWTEALTVAPTTATATTTTPVTTPTTTTALSAPITDVKTELPNADAALAKHFPVCSAATIKAADSDSACPTGAMVGNGIFYSQLAQPALPTSYRGCNPDLDIFNGGNGKLVYFVTLGPRHQCDGFRTGSIPPWTGTLTESGSTLVLDMPFPADISTDVGGGLTNGLQTLDLRLLKTVVSATVPTYVAVPYKVKVKVKVKVHGKTVTRTRLKTKTKEVLKTVTRDVAFFQSTGCSSNQRTATVAITATNGSVSGITDVTNTAAC